jgi:hypothetical protein
VSLSLLSSFFFAPQAVISKGMQAKTNTTNPAQIRFCRFFISYLLIILFMIAISLKVNEIKGYLKKNQTNKKRRQTAIFANCLGCGCPNPEFIILLWCGWVFCGCGFRFRFGAVGFSFDALNPVIKSAFTANAMWLNRRFALRASRERYFWRFKVMRTSGAPAAFRYFLLWNCHFYLSPYFKIFLLHALRDFNANAHCCRNANVFKVCTF